MLPYGMKIVPTAVGSGFTIGAGYGALFGTAAGPAGTLAGALGGGTTGAVQGFRIGMAATMYGMEYTNAMFEAIGNAGFDITNPDEVQQALDKESVWKEARDVGAQRGIPIAIVDYLSAGIAGKVFGTAKRFGSTMKRLALAPAEQMVAGPAAEGLGEY
jgi:hypothetical protein